MIHRIARPLILATLLGAAFGAQATAAAAPATVSFTGYNTGSVDVALAGSFAGTARAGEFAGKLDGASFTSYCIELTQYISAPGGPYNDYVLRPLQSDSRFGASQIDRLNRLYTNYLADSRLDSAHSAGFQLAIWEITYDGGASGALNLGTGNFQLGANGSGASAAIGLAQGYLTGLDGKPTSSLVFQELNSPTYQDQLLSRVPEPGTLALALMGVVGWAGSRRSRRAA